MLSKYKLTVLAAAALASALSAPSFAQSATVRIGLLTDQGGTYARIGGYKEVGIAARLALADYQAEGGKLNAQFFSSDEGSNPVFASANAQSLIEKDQVSLITGIVSSGSAAAVFKVGGARKVVTYVTSGSSTALINSSCTPYSVQGMQNTYNLAKGVVPELVRQGKKKWLIVYADYIFGSALRDDAKTLIEGGGGTLVGSISHPFPATDFVEVIKAAKAANADVIGVASAGSDMVGFLTEAKAASLATETKTIVPLSLFMQDINDLGFEKAAGLTIYGSFFWNQSPQTEAFSKRFLKDAYRMPDMAHAVTYSSVYQYLKAADAVGAVDNDKIMAYLKSHEINDAIFQHAHLRADGSLIHDGYVVRIKSRAEAANPWDYYQKLRAVKGEDVAFPIERSTCANVVKPTPAPAPTVAAPATAQK
jgi:branched-chain amino acid transport system substrate-binding protein